MSRTFNAQLILAALCMVTMMMGCGGGGDDVTTLGDRDTLLPEQLVPEIQVQIVDHQYRVSGLSHENLNPDPIRSIIASATSSLDIAVTRINRQEVVDALLTEAQSGTQIRIITEKAYYDADNYIPFYAQLEDQTKNGGNIDIHTDEDGLPRLMHARFLIIDNARVVTGSYNWETVNSEKTYGDVITILNTAVAAAFANQFNQMFIEGNFGVHKRNDTQHSFLVGAGNGLLEVYFGPGDQPRELLLSEVGQSANVTFAIQQFKDLVLAEYMLGWISSNPNNSLIALFNDFGPQGDFDENAVYDAFRGLTEDTEFSGGALYVNDLIDFSGTFNGYNVMNHKLLICDHAYSNQEWSAVFSTSNYSELGFTLNDEVMLIMRGVPLVSKYWRGLALSETLPPETLQLPGDVQEFDQLFAMWPYVASPEAPLFRDFGDVPCGIVYGSVDNFRPTITIQTGDGEFTDIDIDLTFSVEGSLYFNGDLYGPITPTVEGDIFEESDIMNPDQRYMLVVPAGEVTLTTIVLERDGTLSELFQPDEITFNIGPGGVKEVNLSINQAAESGTTPGTGGGL